MAFYTQKGKYKYKPFIFILTSLCVITQNNTAIVE